MEQRQRCRLAAPEAGQGGGGVTSRQRVANKIGFLKVPRPCERAEWAATETSWKSREGFSSGGIYIHHKGLTGSRAGVYTAHQ